MISLPEVSGRFALLYLYQSGTESETESNVSNLGEDSVSWSELESKQNPVTINASFVDCIEGSSSFFKSHFVCARGFASMEHAVERDTLSEAVGDHNEKKVGGTAEENPNSESHDPETEEGHGLSHKEAMNTVWGEIEGLLKDPLLNDLPSDVTAEELRSQIALEYGQAMTVNVRQQSGQVVPVVIVQGATVLDFKKAIKRHFAKKLEREGGNKYISWRYIWRTYWLVFDGEKLEDNDRKIKDYGIRNRDEVTFVKRYKRR
ncbi:uncharacterized protein [Ptychodera flava]|uniref:uncharacterized protein isoform X2 n=1 Tax=Ptychodera flava TaxID=63121 RepID=UPI00396A1EA1